MTTTRRLSLAYLALTAGVAVLFALNLFWGSVSLTPGAVAAALLGRGEDALAVGMRGSGICYSSGSFCTAKSDRDPFR